ncbi:hypothetical protein HK104_010776 [Borealophlyctis nickersoniae]|nr:hypothetical protein HK104_010776 [Borealophlyctis nickersoniae]
MRWLQFPRPNRLFHTSLPLRMSKPKPRPSPSPASALPPSPITLLKDGAVKLSILVKPNAKESKVTDIGIGEGGRVGLQLAAPPRDGEANEELVRVLAEILNTKKYNLSLLSGQKSREKVVRVEGLSLEEAKARLTANLQS